MHREISFEKYKTGQTTVWIRFFVLLTISKHIHVYFFYFHGYIFLYWYNFLRENKLIDLIDRKKNHFLLLISNKTFDE